MKTMATRFAIWLSVTLATIASAAAQAPTTSLQDLMNNVAPAPKATIYVARKIITMNPDQPTAEAVAVVGNRIAAVGSRKELIAKAGEQKYRIDETFADKVLIAGFVEPHFHPWLAALTMATDAVIAIEDWDTPNGLSASVRDGETYRKRLGDALRSFDAGSGETFLSWGYHHYFHGELSRAVLDEMAPDLPVVIWHRSAHELYLNSAAIKKHNVDDAFLGSFSDYEKAQSNVEKGHFFELGAIKVLERVGGVLASPERLKEGLEYSAAYGLQSGITVAAEPGTFYSKPLQDAVNRVYGADSMPFRQYFMPDGKSIAAAHLESGTAKMLAETKKTLAWGSGQARFLPQQVKMFTDGAMFSQLMQMRDGYTDGHDGEWLMYPDKFSEAFQAYWDDGYTIHVHNNGDGGMDVLIANLERALRRNPRFDHRTNVHHFGFAASDQIKRLKELGAVISANPYYVTALAGRYADVGIGPERSANMVPLGAAERAGLTLSFHSDMPMGPAKPLLLVWSAVNRIIAEGGVAGPDQRVSLEKALRAITIDAAYGFRLDKEIGSIEPGKLANFTVLEKSPFEVRPEDLRDIGIWGTVLEGRVQAVPAKTQKKARLLRAPTQAALRVPPGGKSAVRKPLLLALGNYSTRVALSRAHARACGHQVRAMRSALSLRLAAQLRADTGLPKR